MRKVLLISLIFAVAAMAADFERSNWRLQLYLQGEFAFLQFKDSDPELLLDKPLDKKLMTFPINAGILWSPLITPFYKADIPFTFWLGAEINSFQFGEIASKPEYYFKGNSCGPKGAEGTCDDAGRDENLSFRSYAPSVLGGFTFNLIGDLDIRVLGGYGLLFFSFYDELLGNTNQKTSVVPTAFVSSALEYKIGEIFKDVDFKIGVNVRRDFLPFENIKATSKAPDVSESGALPPGYSGIEFDKISYKLPVRVGIELSLDFGRESRRDRRMRYVLHDRDDVLRKNSEVKDTLSDWDCMAIERDYRFFLDEDGNLPDMSESFTKTQFSDVLESFLAFCHPEDLATKEKLYATLDTGRVQLKEYQTRQEDSRFEQVMASNDPEMLAMYLEYYPDSPHRPEVEAKLKVLGEYHKFREIQAQNTFKAYLGYLNDNPDGAFRDEAEAGIFELVKGSGRLKDYEIYLKRFPEGKFVEEAKAALQNANADAPSMIEVQTGETEEAEEAPAKKQGKKAQKKAKGKKKK
ncbi:MAG: hypothetical protein IKS02_06245 [Fibrobacter sp.]|nr:hypothetical protein [Fibrobacter sp.]